MAFLLLVTAVTTTSLLLPKLETQDAIKFRFNNPIAKS